MPQKMHSTAYNTMVFGAKLFSPIQPVAKGISESQKSKLRLVSILTNLNLLFWLSLMPFATGWMGENNFAPNTIVLYAVECIFCGIAYSLLQNIILKACDPRDKMTIAIRKQNKKVLASTICA